MGYWLGAKLRLNICHTLDFTKGLRSSSANGLARESYFDFAGRSKKIGRGLTALYARKTGEQANISRFVTLAGQAR